MRKGAAFGQPGSYKRRTSVFIAKKRGSCRSLRHPLSFFAERKRKVWYDTNRMTGEWEERNE
ncbi:hypothetical protein B4113_0701 [Geobacillus sp. B4113_201601]|nr:hypothetical protein B4113_0701 [Geobacillus sp. B4113_201601]